MEYQNNLVKLDTSLATVRGRDFSIEDRETGRVFVTNKHYIDKLFYEMGFKNRNVIVILEEFAGKFISDVGKLNTSNLYIDETTDSFVVTSEDFIEWLKEMFRQFKKEGHNILNIKYPTPYHEWNELLIESKNGNRFAFYINMYEEAVYVLSLEYDGATLVGITDEGSFSHNSRHALGDLFSLMSTPINSKYMYTYDAFISMHEYIELLEKLGYVEKKKRGTTYFITDKGANASDIPAGLELTLEDFNLTSWLLRHMNKMKNFDFTSACKLISGHINESTYWDFKDFYQANAKETSDYFALN